MEKYLKELRAFKISYSSPCLELFSKRKIWKCLQPVFEFRTQTYGIIIASRLKNPVSTYVVAFTIPRNEVYLQTFSWRLVNDFITTEENVSRNFPFYYSFLCSAEADNTKRDDLMVKMQACLSQTLRNVWSRKVFACLLTLLQSRRFVRFYDREQPNEVIPQSEGLIVVKTPLCFNC